MTISSPSVLKVNELVTVQGVFLVNGEMNLYDTYVAFVDQANRHGDGGTLVTFVPWNAIHYWTGPAQ